MQPRLRRPWRCFLSRGRLSGRIWSFHLRFHSLDPRQALYSYPGWRPHRQLCIYLLHMLVRDLTRCRDMHISTTCFPLSERRDLPSRNDKCPPFDLHVDLNKQQIIISVDVRRGKYTEEQDLKNQAWDMPRHGNLRYPPTMPVLVYCPTQPRVGDSSPMPTR